MKNLLVTLGDDEILIWATNKGGGVQDGNQYPATMEITSINEAT